MIEAYERFGQEVPKDLIAPGLQDIEWAYWEAFWELSTERQIGMNAGPIPWSAIHKYAEISGSFSFDIFYQIIRLMDNAYLSRDKNESKTFSREMFKD